MEFIPIILVLVMVPFLLPIGLWVALYRTRTRLTLIEERLEERVEAQNEAIAQLAAAVAQLRALGPARPAAEPPAPRRGEPDPAGIAPAAPAVAPAPRIPPPPLVRERPPIAPPERPAVPPAQPTPPVSTPPASTPSAGAPLLTPPGPGAPSLPQTSPVTPGSAPTASKPAAAPSVGPAPSPIHPRIPPPAPPSVPPPPRAAQPPPPPPPPSTPAFDWESVVGVKLFSAIAGIALVFAAVLFLRYSMQQGWLQPPVRVLIGTAVAIGLLILCEMKAAREYPATANALDAAAIAILFATFFAAHALWNLIPATLTFALLAAVTALAVALSIRRESLFIAVLGLLGGFSTPALLSTGENRPIPLFAYLALLNIGLAWVAYRQVWPVLTILTLVLTTIYQWVWVLQFMTANELSLAMGIFAVFPVLSVGAFLLGRRGQTRPHGAEDDAFEQTAVFGAALPLVFIAYLATVPAYGARPALLFGFLLFVDIGLLAVSLALRRFALHVVAALATLLVWAVWLTTSYRPDARVLALAFTSAFVVLYLIAPVVARWMARPLSERGAGAILAAPALLFVFPVIAGIDPAAAPAAPLFGPLAVLVLLCAAAAFAFQRGAVFFTASFLAVAAQAVWSATHLTIERLPAAVAVYALFGVITAAVPVISRRRGRTLEPEAGGAVVLLASLGLLLFLSTGPIAPAALWAMALLLAILNAALFIESASSRVPLLAQVGSVLSWLILAVWWHDAAGVVGILPSLAVLTGLTLVTLAGHAWASRGNAGDRGAERARAEDGHGLYLGLIGHFYLIFVATNPEWSLPPWPVFGTLGVITLATSMTAILVCAPMLHVIGVGAAAAVLNVWTAVALAPPWPQTGLLAAAALSVYALAWIAVAGRVHSVSLARAAAAVALFGGEVTAIMCARASSPAPFRWVLALHVADIVLLLLLTQRAGWNHVAAGAVGVSWLALLQWQGGHDLAIHWPELLVLAGAFYAMFTGYALVAGPRKRDAREPWLVALAAAAMTFFAAREAFEAGGLEWMIGVVPVVQGLVTGLLLRALLRLERTGERDMARLALVAGAALAFVTVAIPLQLEHQWITIGWALEGAALAWLYLRVPHRGLVIVCGVLFAAVFARLAVNPEIWMYEPRGELRVFNWYLYTYLLAAASMLLSTWFLSTAEDRPAAGLPRLSHVLPGAAVILLFLLLNIEIADYYATGAEIVFRFGESVSQDLTYTIGWLAFGMILLIAGIYLHNRPARATAVTLIAITTLKCFLYDLKSLEGLYRIGSFVGLAVALAVVSMILQKYVLVKPKAAS